MDVARWVLVPPTLHASLACSTIYTAARLSAPSLEHPTSRTNAFLFLRRADPRRPDCVHWLSTRRRSHHRGWRSRHTKSVPRVNPHRVYPLTSDSAADAQEECTYYDYPPNDSTVKDFPPNWVQPATLLPNDATAQALWAQIKPSIPTNIAPRGTVNGDFSGVNYPSSDPDCWWTYSQCTTPKLAGLVPDITGIPEPQSLGYGFDDGPNCSHNAFYDYLTEQQQKASECTQPCLCGSVRLTVL